MVFDAFETAIGGCRLRLCRRRRRRAVRMVTVGLVGLGAAATMRVVGVDAAFAELSARTVTNTGNSNHYGYGVTLANSDKTRVIGYAQGDRVDVDELDIAGPPETFTSTDFPGGSAANTGSYESLGNSVDVDVVDGSDIIVGEPQFTTGSSEGRVWVMDYTPSTRTIGTPTELTFPTGTPPKSCGDRVAIRGDVAVVRCRDNAGTAHEIYIFERDNANVWQRVLNKSTPGTVSNNNMYGNSIGLVLSSSGKYIVAISDHLDNNGHGQVEMCTRDTTTALGTTTPGAWTCAPLLSPSSTPAPSPGGGTPSVSFGRYLCMDDVYMMVGAPGDGANGADGSYYVYKRDSNDAYQDESQQLTVTEGSPERCTMKGDYFAAYTINGAGLGNGDAFYVFEKDSSGIWNEKLFAHDPDCQQGFSGTDFDTGFVIIDDTTSSPFENYVRLEAGCTMYANPNVARPSSYPTGRQTGAIFTFNIEEIPSGSPGGGLGGGSGSGSGSGTGSNSDDLSDDEVAGIAVGCVAFIALIIIFICVRRRKSQPAYVVPAPASGRQQQQPQVIVLQS